MGHYARFAGVSRCDTLLNMCHIMAVRRALCVAEWYEG